MPMRSTPSGLALVALAALCGLSGVVRAEGDVPPEQQVQADYLRAMASTLTRAEVLAETLLAMTAGTMSAVGEIAEPPAVLDARDRYNVAQAREIAERTARIEAEQAALAQAAALRLPPGRQIASSSAEAALAVITERADGTPIEDERATSDAPADPGEPDAPAPAATAAVLHERRD